MKIPRDFRGFRKNKKALLNEDSRSIAHHVSSMTVPTHWAEDPSARASGIPCTFGDEHIHRPPPEPIPLTSVGYLVLRNLYC